MSTRVDALRNTLDHLALDPKASEDRRYLVSMLRRLGYSDAEIEAELGPIGGEPGRVIEVEYEPAEHPGEAGPRSRETTFQVSGPQDGLSFRLSDEDAPAGAGVEEVHATDISGVESDLGDWGDDYEQGARDDFTSLGDAPDDFLGEAGEGGGRDDDFSFQEEADEEVVEFRSVSRPDPAVAAGWQEDAPDTWGDQTEAAWGEPESGEADLAWAPPAEEGEDAWTETTDAEADAAWAEEPAPEQWSDSAEQVAEAEQAGEEVVPWPEEPESAEADAAWPQEATEEPPDAADAGAETAWPEEADAAGAEWPEEPEASAETEWPQEATEDAWEDATWEDADEAAAPAAEAEAAPEPYAHGDYTLYTREVHLSTGREQRIYFFAKSTPQSGDPCPLPDGYEVIENDKTGLPFLRRQR